MKHLELRKQALAILDQQKALSETAESENRNFTEDEQSKFDSLQSEKVSLLDRADRIEAIEEEDKKRSIAAGKVISVPDDKTEKRVVPKTAYRTGHLKAFQGDNAEEKAFRFYHWANAALNSSRRSLDFCKENDIELRDMSEGVNVAGGYLVPEEFSQTIIDLREVYGVFRRSVSVVPMGREVMTMAKRSSGLTTYWLSEGATITSSDKAWGQVTLTAKKLAALTVWSSELDEDAAISIADDLANEIAYAFALAEDNAGFLGDGTSTYGGHYGLFPKINDGTHTASISTAATTLLAFSDLTNATFEDALGKLPEYAAQRNPAWFISRVGFYASMARLLDAGGGNTISDLGAGPTLQYLGVPVRISQVLNSTTTDQASTVVACVGDLSLAATMGERRGVTISTDSSVYFTTDELAIKGTERVAINVHSLGDTSTAGPMIGVKTAAS